MTRRRAPKATPGPRTHGTCRTPGCGALVTGERWYCGPCVVHRELNRRTRRTK